MRNIFNISKNTFREAIRDKILYGILAFAFLFLAGTVMLGSISLGEDIKVVKDFGLAGIYIFSIIIAIFLGTSLIYKEIEKKTLYIIFSKPVTTIQYLVGKFFGLWASIVLNVALMTIVHLIIVKIKGGGFDFISLYSIIVLVFELAVFIALTILFSTITAPLAGAIFSIIFLFIGHSLDMLKKYAEKGSWIFKNMIDAIYYIFPNLEKFDLRNGVVHGIVPTSGQIIYPILYSILYVTILLWISSVALKKRDL